MFYKSFLKPLLFRLDPEQAHELTCDAARKAVRSGLMRSAIKGIYNYQSPRLSQTFWGHSFRNPIGLAAGFDKNGQMIKAMEILGMGFVEVGSITAQVSCGNPKPRAFRLPEDHALINRMGLNNDGAQTIIRRLQNTRFNIPVGVNIAKTHDPGIMGQDAIDDYLFSYREARSIADYITINISCPNTEEGKTFETPEVLDQLLTTLLNDDQHTQVPTLVKVSSDLSLDLLETLIEVCESHRIDGYVACNTSSSRNNLQSGKELIDEIGPGGLSGPPLSFKSMRIIKRIRYMISDHKPIIGVGGIDSFSTALNMLKSGANLLQIYTGFIYEGPGLIKRINRKLDDYLDKNNLDSIRNIPAE